MEYTQQDKIEALAQHLETDCDDAERKIDNDDYLVLTDEEADERAEDEGYETLWAFNAGFLFANSSQIETDMIKRIQKEYCESAQPIIVKMLGGEKKAREIVREAVSIDGRGHFLSRYDGHEREVTHNGKTFYIYRQN